MTSTVDGRVTKLRASCDACNEAKVRCSQTKPTCARCEKNDTNCVYGLSRRSHKNAPRIGTSQGSAYTHCPSPSGHTRTMSISENTNSSNTSSSSSSSPPSRLRSQPNTPLPMQPALSPPSAPGTGHNNLMLGTTHMNTTTQLPTLPPDDHLFSEFGLALDGTGADVFGQDYDMLDFPTSSSPQNNHMADSIMGGDLLEFSLPLQQQLEQQQAIPPPLPPPAHNNSPCSCASRLMTELAAMPPGSAASCDRFDAQLSQLRRVINITEDCITCPCTTQDDMSISTYTYDHASPKHTHSNTTILTLSLVIQSDNKHPNRPGNPRPRGLAHAYNNIAVFLLLLLLLVCPRFVNLILLRRCA
ncbi:hypothetical protein BJX65DRAFT_14668 [Aspergillus insuetus]